YAEAASAVGNASSLHGSGRRARRRVEEARESLAHHLGCRPSEVVFTSGGTESDNLAVLGQAGAAAGDVVAVGATEHHSVLAAPAARRRRPASRRRPTGAGARPRWCAAPGGPGSRGSRAGGRPAPRPGTWWPSARRHATPASTPPRTCPRTARLSDSVPPEVN